MSDPAIDAGAAPKGAAPSASKAKSLVAQVAALAKLGVPALRAKYAEVFGEETRSRNRDWLFRSVAWQVQALAEGGLSERARRRAEEIARECDVRPRDGPPGTQSTLPAEVTAPAAARPAPRDPGSPVPGTVLVRRYRGEEVRVRVIDAGFEWNGRVFRSLTAVAEAVTGAHWSGVLFFGLKRPPRGAPK